MYIVAGLLLVVLVLMTGRWLVAGIAFLRSRMIGQVDGMFWTGPGAAGLRRRRTSEFRTVVSHLELITRLNLPLVPAISSFASGETRRVADMMHRIERGLREGAPLHQALGAAMPHGPPQALAMLAHAERCGQLRRGLADLNGMLKRAMDAESGGGSRRAALLYGCLVMLIVVSFGLWAAIVVLPKYREIFLDFETPLPPATLFYFSVTDWMAAHFPELVLTTGLAAAGLAAVALIGRMRTDDHDRVRWIRHLRALVPVQRSIDFGLGMAKVARGTAHALVSGTLASTARSIPKVVSPTNPLQSSLVPFCNALADGVPPASAARNAGMGHAYVCALSSIERGGCADQLMEHVARYYEAIALRRWRMLEAMIGPAVTLVLAVAVGTTAFALFLPMVSLIDSVTETIW